MKDVLKPDQETGDDLALAEQDSDEVEDKDTPRLAFTLRGPNGFTGVSQWSTGTPIEADQVLETEAL